MRVVVVSGIYPPDIGGPATHSEDLRRELAERGHRVTVLTLWDGPCVSHRPGLIRFPRRWSWPARQAAVATWLAGHRSFYDVVYATGLHPAAVAGARLAGRPVVLKVVGDPVWERGRRLGLTASGFASFQDTAPRGGRLGAMRWLRDWSLRRATAITTPSGFLADVVEEWLGGPADVTVVQNGVRIGEEPAPTPRAIDSRLRVIYVGRLVAHKRVNRLVAAVAATPEVTLEIVGSGPEADRLRTEVDALGVPDRVRLHGDLSHPEVLRHLRAADVLALASDYEGLPHVVLEALASGTPVVSPAVGGVIEVLRDGEGGLILDDAEVVTIAAALARLRDDPTLRERLGEGAAEVGAQWTVGRTTDHVEDLLRRTVTGAPRVVFVGKSRVPDRATIAREGAEDQRRRVEILVARMHPTVIGVGRVGVHWIGRQRVVALPDLRPPIVGGALFYAVAPAVAAIMSMGRRGTAVVCQSPYEGIGATALTAVTPASLRPKIVVEIHGDWRTATRLYGSPARRYLAPIADQAAAWAVRRADVVRSVGAFTAELAREVGFDGAIDTYTAFGDLEAFVAAPLVDMPGAPRVVFVGALERAKGVDVLLDAWPSVLEEIPDARLSILGDGSMRPALERAVERGLLERSVSFAGAVARSSVREAVDDAQMVAVPSRTEGLGRVILEAFSRARPVVASDVGGVPESVDHGTTGLLVPADDPGALAESLLGLLRAPGRARVMGEAARSWIEARCDDTGFDAGIERLGEWALR